MQDTQKAKTPTPEQEAWDKKYGRYERISLIGLGAWLIFNVGSFTWVVLSKIVPFLVIAASGINRDDPARIAASHDYGNGLLWLLFIVLVSAGLSLPFRRALSNSFASLGERPADTDKPQAPTSV